MSMSKAEFDKELKSVKSRGASVTKEFSSLVRTGVQLYWGETNHNIQVINDLIDCARALKGLRVLALVEYLNEVVPHSNKGKKEQNHYGKMDASLKQKMTGTWDSFLINNPNWYEFTVEKNPQPFDFTKLLKTVESKLKKAHEKGEADLEGLVTFKEAIRKFSFDDEVTDESVTEAMQQS